MKRSRAALAGLLAVLVTTAHADTVYTVTSTLDEIDVDAADGQCRTAAGTCTLRAAVMQANVATTDTTIMLPSGVYTFTRAPTIENDADSGDLNFATPASGNPKISLAGAGAATTIINAHSLDRVILIEGGRTAVISGVTIREGLKSGSYGGGGIANLGILTLSHSVVRENQADIGGGITNDGTAAVVTDSAVVANHSFGRGGGIYSHETLYLTRSAVSDNVIASGSNRLGGGIYSFATLVIDRSTLAGNAADIGGAIFNEGHSVIMRNSTLSGNTAERFGGAICNISWGTGPGMINIYNSSIIGNEADSDQDSIGDGGGLFNEVDSTINIRNTLLARNYRSGSAVDDDCNGTVGVYGNNLFFSFQAIADCTFTGPGEVGGINSAALIGPLQNNGGPTLTHALLPGSNAIDGADPVGGCVDESLNPLSTDQRGYPRVAGLRCDVGAFEYGDTIFLDGFD